MRAPSVSYRLFGLRAQALRRFHALKRKPQALSAKEFVKSKLLPENLMLKEDCRLKMQDCFCSFPLCNRVLPKLQSLSRTSERF